MKRLLIVVDMQNDFVNGALGTAEAVKTVPAVIKKIKNFDGDVIYTKDTHSEQYLSTLEGRHLPIQHCKKGTDGWRLVPEIEKLFLDMQCRGFEKQGFGAKQLPEWIEKTYPEGPEEIVLIGLCTDICVLTNAIMLKVFFPQTEITVDAACCAGVTPEGHANALAAMRTCQINIINA
ncbi:MAG: isochorismatase family cysteine hydrolase [Oscillospiraceae bacterium]|nr:isochorismatase family cysteine hydrolase [Oscillospiraceae bacterium]